MPTPSPTVTPQPAAWQLRTKPQLRRRRRSRPCRSAVWRLLLLGSFVRLYECVFEHDRRLCASPSYRVHTRSLLLTYPVRATLCAQSAVAERDAAAAQLEAAKAEAEALSAELAETRSALEQQRAALAAAAVAASERDSLAAALAAAQREGEDKDAQIAQLAAAAVAQQALEVGSAAFSSASASARCTVINAYTCLTAQFFVSKRRRSASPQCEDAAGNRGGLVMEAVAERPRYLNLVPSINVD